MYRKRRCAGFNLIELMAVLIILSILATVVSVRVIDRIQDAKRAKAKADIAQFKTALKLFSLDNGFYPSTDQGLQALVEQPTVGQISEHYREGGYLEAEKVPSDAWEHPYIYMSPGTGTREFEIESYGRDGQDGGEGHDADIESWRLDE